MISIEFLSTFLMAPSPSDRLFDLGDLSLFLS